jgi:arginine N-succinyltransferase
MDQAFVIRPATVKDLDWLYSHSHLFGVGFTSLPHNKDFLKQRLQLVERSFKEQLPVEERIYLFLRENLPKKEIVGICGIDVNVGYKESFYNYQISTVTQSSAALNIYMEHQLLNLVNNYQHASELISFWLQPSLRGKNIGKSLSFSRFLFMAQFPQYINSTVIAEVRGYFDMNEISPFWEAVGRKFFSVDFKVADELTFANGKQFISDLCSREPIYIDLLPKDVQAVIGKEHPDASPARVLLEQQGFRFSNHVDIFDAGPLLAVERDSIKTVMESKVATVVKFADENDQEALLYNNRLDARFTVAPITVLPTGEVTISKQIADILHVKVGEEIRYYFM